ncbi:MAG: MerR family transcriptional regulator [Candidatus Dormibacteraeota bacterium]|nr:MerR family transcriptional regulator [Candidatus Dormibacteraeota bacterium]
MVITEDLSIANAAEATGLSTHTLRYYERVGLMLDRIGRASSSHRRYSDDEIRWVVFLTKLRRTGMPIRVMREYADLVRRRRQRSAASHHSLQGQDVVPIPGTKRRRYLEENVAALDMQLTSEDFWRLAQVGAGRDDRYADMSPISR